jgi:hypothetical protein
MQLSPELESLLALAPAEKREGMRKELEGGFLRQEDYSRRMNELTENVKVQAAAYETGKKWVDDSRTYYKEATQRVKDLEAKLAAIETPSKATVFNDPDINVDDPAALAKALREARADARQANDNYAKLSETVQRVDKMIADGQLVTADQLNVEANKRFEAYGEAILQTIETVQRANGEYGKPIDRKVLLAEAAKYGGDLGKAYESVTSDMRMDKMRADLRAEITKEVRGEYEAKGTPLAGGGAPLELGPLQQRIYQSGNKESTIDSNIPADGSHRLAHAIGAELRAEGKF